MAEKRRAVKWYHLTIKAYRAILAIEEYEKKIGELNKLSDEEIMKLVQEKESPIP